MPQTSPDKPVLSGVYFDPHSGRLHETLQKRRRDNLIEAFRDGVKTVVFTGVTGSVGGAAVSCVLQLVHDCGFENMGAHFKQALPFCAEFVLPVAVVGYAALRWDGNKKIMREKQKTAAAPHRNLRRPDDRKPISDIKDNVWRAAWWMGGIAGACFYAGTARAHWREFEKYKAEKTITAAVPAPRRPDPRTTYVLT